MNRESTRSLFLAARQANIRISYQSWVTLAILCLLQSLYKQHDKNPNIENTVIARVHSVQVVLEHWTCIVVEDVERDVRNPSFAWQNWRYRQNSIKLQYVRGKVLSSSSLSRAFLLPHDFTWGFCDILHSLRLTTIQCARSHSNNTS